jgi:hypothetical protein
LVRDPRRVSWLPAYENIHGAGTQVRRARAIARILEDRAQLPDEGLGQFTKDVWRMVEGAIGEVCSDGSLRDANSNIDPIGSKRQKTSPALTR